LYRRLTPAGRRDADRARTLGYLGPHPGRLATIRRWWRAWCRQEGRLDVRVGSRRGGRTALVSVDLGPLQALDEATVEQARTEILRTIREARLGVRLIAHPAGLSVLDLSPSRAAEVAEAVARAASCVIRPGCPAAGDRPRG
jgi:hypothetical protein